MDKPEVREFARQAPSRSSSVTVSLPEGRRTENRRILETIQFAKKMGYKKMGWLFQCVWLMKLRKLTEMFEKHGFEIVSVTMQGRRGT